MTREEAIKFGKRVLSLSLFDETHEFCEIAVKALSQVSEIEENIIKYMKKYPNHVGNTDFWEGFYACRNVVLQLDNEYSPKEQEPISVSVSEKEPDEISEEVTLRFFRNTLKVRWQDLVIYNVEWLKKNWQMEMDIVCGVKPCDDVVSIEAVIEWLKAKDIIKMSSQEKTARKELKAFLSVRPQEQTGKWEEIVKEHKCYARDDTYTTTEYHCSECGEEPFVNEDGFYELSNYCPNCGARMVEQKETETWHGIHAQITAPKGTFERIFNEADDDYDI